MNVCLLLLPTSYFTFNVTPLSKTDSRAHSIYVGNMQTHTHVPSCCFNLSDCVRYEHLDCLHRLHSLGYELNADGGVDFLCTAAEAQDGVYLKLAHDLFGVINLCPRAFMALDAALRCNQLENIRYLHEVVGLPFNFDATKVIVGGTKACWQYLVAKGVDITKLYVCQSALRKIGCGRYTDSDMNNCERLTHEESIELLQYFIDVGATRKLAACVNLSARRSYELFQLVLKACPDAVVNQDTLNNAVESNDMRTVRHIIEDCKVSPTLVYPWNPGEWLRVAMCKGFTECVRYLIEQRAPCPRYSQVTDYSQAGFCINLETVQLMHQYEYPVERLLPLAVSSNKIETVKYIIEECGGQIKDSFYDAARLTDTAIIRYMHSRGCTFTDAFYGWCSLETLKFWIDELGMKMPPTYIQIILDPYNVYDNPNLDRLAAVKFAVSRGITPTDRDLKIAIERNFHCRALMVESSKYLYDNIVTFLIQHDPQLLQQTLRKFSLIPLPLEKDLKCVDLLLSYTDDQADVPMLKTMLQKMPKPSCKVDVLIAVQVDDLLEWKGVRKYVDYWYVKVGVEVFKEKMPHTYKLLVEAVEKTEKMHELIVTVTNLPDDVVKFHMLSYLYQ